MEPTTQQKPDTDTAASKAKEHCCQESIYSAPSLPCNQPATKLISFPSGEGPYRMCDGCADHTLKNRGGVLVGNYSPGPGHNNPPETIKDRLRLERPDIFDRLDQLKDACEKAPRAISDEETAKRVSDLLKMSRKAIAAAEEARKVEQGPWQKKLDETRAAFVVPSEALKTAMKAVKESHDAYLQRKKDEAKRAAEAEAKRQREEAERQAAAAAEAERKAREAEREAAEAKEAARKAQLEREQAQEDARRARAELAQAKEDEQRREAERKQKAAEEEAERKRLAREAEQNRADVAAQEAREADREAKSSIDEAMRSETRSEKQEALAAGKAADLSRVRSDHGAVTSLSERTIVQIVDYDRLPRGILWGFIAKDAIDAAVKRAKAAGYTERELPGVRFVTTEEGRTV